MREDRLDLWEFQSKPVQSKASRQKTVQRMGLIVALFSFTVLVLLSGCSANTDDSQKDSKATAPAKSSSESMSIPSDSASKTSASGTKDVVKKTGDEPKIDEQPSTVYYEIFVRSFYDSNGDGIGDLNGVTEKLDYLKNLGVGGIWLMPIQSSPSYHGYDVTDYFKVNPQYGTMQDFQHLTKEAHKRGIKVILDLVLNHTSDQNPWFIQSASDKKSTYRNWYIWAEDNGLSTDRVSAIGTNPWHEKNGDHYLGIFWQGMPDLNYDTPAVRKKMIDVGQFWLKQGADGFRLDAAQHIYGDFQGDTQNSNIVKKNVAWWQQFRQGIDQVNKNAYLVGEVWESASIIAPYLNQALNSCFNFDLATQLIDAVKTEQSTDLGFYLHRIYALYSRDSHGQFVDAPILSNHDQDRVMSDLDGDVDHMKMAAGLLLTLPGNPFIYYGEEIGMKGKKPDEQIREPMRWNQSLKAKGETQWENPMYNLDAQTSVEAEENDPNSLLHYYKMLIQWREQLPALKNGSIDDYDTKNDQVMGYIRMTQNQTVLVLHNLSGQSQTLSLEKYHQTSFAQIAQHSKAGATLQDHTVSLPAYSTVVLK